MKTSLFLKVLILAILAFTATKNYAKRAEIETRVKNPYVGAIVRDADTGQILFIDNADEQAYPASVLKLMNLYVILDLIHSGKINLTDQVKITAEAARIGGSQVYLKEGETFTVDELLYALMVQSANDAATALAIHIAGSKEAFVELMNKKAQELNMKNTVFYSVHGLPPSEGQKPDVITARDLSLLCIALLKKFPETLRYTGTQRHLFRNNTMVIENHNGLLKEYTGCDGLKTGYFKKAGYSIAATAKRGNTRIIAIVLGIGTKEIRNKTVAQLLNKGFQLSPPKEEPVASKNIATSNTPSQNSTNLTGSTQASSESRSCSFKIVHIIVFALLIVASIVFILAFLRYKNRSEDESL
jgi:D-alanyl-D-alanine carboxypeptidase (penicillin-binding protein 5/6)